MKDNPGKTIKLRDVASLTKVPFMLAFSPENVRSGFKKPGIWPLNTEPFNNDDFAPSTIWHQDGKHKLRPTAI